MTADVLNMSQLELPATLTYSRRILTWLPNADRETVPLGVMIVQLQHSRRVHAKYESDSYAVEETPSMFGTGRTFLVLNLTDPDADEVYEVYLAPGGIGFCTCKAGACKVPTKCKHVHSLQALIEEGLL